MLVLLGLWIATASGDFRHHVGARATVSEGAEEAAEQYDPKLAKALAALSKLAYCGPLNGTAHAILRSTSGVMEEAGLKLDSPRLVTHADLLAPKADFATVARFTALSGDSYLPARGCVIAFRGTDNEANNVENSRQRLESWDTSTDPTCKACQVCEGCKVFGGYKAVWKQLRPGVLRELQGLGCQSGDPLLLTGHNLGAGLMTLAMYSLKSEDAYNVQLSYNFESPRIGNLAFAQFFNHFFGRRVALFRITHDNDGVPHYPEDPAYMHVGNQVWYPGNDAEEYTVCANSTASQGCGNDAIRKEKLCPLVKEDCKGDGAIFCKLNCGFPPASGPHCVHPLAPADNFCDFAGDTLEHMQEEFERSCVRGEAALMTTPVPTTPLPPGAVACSDADVSWQPLDMLGTAVAWSETAADCQELCRKTEGCEHFSFWPFLKSCHREDGEAYSMSHSSGAVSGPKVCSERDVEAKFLSAAPALRGPLAKTRHALVGLASVCAAALLLGACLVLRGHCNCRRRRGSLKRVSRDGAFRAFCYEFLGASSPPENVSAVPRAAPADLSRPIEEGL